MINVRPAFNDFLHLFFPHICIGCGSDIIDLNHQLCLRCLSELPVTGFFMHGNNPVEEKFYGRMPVQFAAAGYYFTKHSVIEHIAYELKYKGNKEVGRYMGRMLGELLKAANRFGNIDVMVPLPLNIKRQKKRGYNQSAMLCEGINAVCNIPQDNNSVIRKVNTETQTHSGRIARLENMQNVFAVSSPSALENKHILLVDDVVTTGASLEACGSEILKVPGTKLSIATLAYTF